MRDIADADFVGWAAPYCSGVGRFIAQASLKRSSNHLALVNPVETWLGPSDPLPLWTANILSACAKRLSAPDEIDADQLEVYAPDIMRRQRRPTPWVAASHISHALPELRICRPLAAHARSWNWPHYLGAFNFAHGGLRLRQSVSLDLDVSARLRFGFDQLLGSPRTASIAIQRDCCVLDVRFGLPAPESKIKSLGWSESERSDSRHLTTFHLSSLPFIQEGLNRLAIRQNLFERNR
jgi:hypothetical protein